jgi:hypothetical protein
MKRTIILALLAAAIVWAGSAGAQTLTGTITGKVTDEQGGVLPGVTVTLTGSQGTASQVTDAKGEFRFIGLSPGVYSVKSEIQGFRPKQQQNLDLGIGKTVDVPLQMAVGGVTEQVDVVANAVVIDTTTTAVDNSLSPTLLTAIPMSHTAAYELLNYSPGINGSSAFGGASDTANSLMLDGVDTRDPAGGTPWMFFNYNLIEEVQVGGIGQPAEYGGFSGAVVNTITKSGGNRFAFMSEMRYTGKSLSGDNTTDAIKSFNPGLANPAIVNKMTDYTVQLGGPVVRDRLFFFGNIQRYSQQDDPTGPRTSHTEISPRFNFKLTANISRTDNLTFSAQYDQYNQKGRTGFMPSSVATDNQTRTEDAPDWMWNAQYRKVLGATAFLEAKFTGYSGYYDLTPIDMSPAHYDFKTHAYSGGAGWISQHDRGRNQVNVSLSKYADLAGKHNFKFGMEIERSTTRDRFAYAGGVYFYDKGGKPYYAYGYSYDILGKNKRESFYGQDQWKMGRFTANIGVRADHIRGEAQATGKEVYSTFSVAPRLGAVYDLTGKGTSVVRAFYGQLYDGAVVDSWYRALPGMTDLTIYDVGPNWQTLTVNDVIPAVNKYTVGTDLKHPRTDEWSVSWDQQLGRNTRFTATGIFRNATNFLNSVLINGLWTTTSFTPPSPSGTPYPGSVPVSAAPITVYKWANKGVVPQQYLIQNVDGVTYNMSGGSAITTNQSRKYKGLMLVLTRSLKDRWQAQISYVLSKTEGNVSNGGESGIASGQFETPNGILVNAFGPAGYDRRHEIKIMGGYQIPRAEVSLSAYFVALSGYNYAPYASVSKSVTAWSGSISTNLEPRGNRKLPFDEELTLRVEKVVNVGVHRFGLYADIGNLFNSTVVTGVVTRVDGSSVLGQTVPFEAPTSLIAGRQATLGVRWSF